MFQYIKIDSKRHKSNFGKRWYFQMGFWIILTYRFGKWGKRIRLTPIGVIINIFYNFANFPWRFFRHVDISLYADIGPGLLLIHPHNIIIPENCRIGNNCTIYHEVTLGCGSVAGEPKLFDNVVVFSGARIFGRVSIGEHAQIGTNAVVQKDVPANVFVLSTPSRILPAKTSKTIYKKKTQE